MDPHEGADGRVVKPPVISAGSSPEVDGRAASPGRYAIVEGEHKQFLYIPQIQELFPVSAEMASCLREADISAPDLVDLRGRRDEEEEERVPTAKRIAELEYCRGKIDGMAQARRKAPIEQDPKDSHADGLKDLVIHVAQICNLRCGYCYAEEINKAKALMTEQTAEKVVEHTWRLAKGQLRSVKFLGGEPTIAWDIVEFIISRFNQRADADGVQRPQYVTVTNGTLITDRIIESMIREKMYVLVSLDGPCEIHDRNRPFSGGRRSHYVVYAALERMVAKGLLPAVEAVYTIEHRKRSISISDLEKYFVSLGIKEMQITIALGVWHKLNTEGATQDLIEDLRSAAIASVRSYASADPFLLRGIHFVLSGFAMKWKRDYVCGAGRTFMAVNHDGRAFPCYLIESDQTAYGFLDERWDEAQYQGVMKKFKHNGKAHHPVCRECWANEICQSCLGSTTLIDPAIAKPPTWFCTLQKEMIGAVLGSIGEIRESDRWPTFIANLSNTVSHTAAD